MEELGTGWSWWCTTASVILGVFAVTFVCIGRFVANRRLPPIRRLTLFCMAVATFYILCSLIRLLVSLTWLSRESSFFDSICEGIHINLVLSVIPLTIIAIVAVRREPDAKYRHIILIAVGLWSFIAFWHILGAGALAMYFVMLMATDVVMAVSQDPSRWLSRACLLYTPAGLAIVGIFRLELWSSGGATGLGLLLGLAVLTAIPFLLASIASMFIERSRGTRLLIALHMPLVAIVAWDLATKPWFRP